MKTEKLKKYANVSISNVDKKTKENELSVKLCNYTDVYYNWSIYSDMQDKLMDATVKQNELEKFKLHIGDVAITKDSETKDDIGKSVYINDNISNCVLGYHCALIRPDNINLDGSYLNALLHTDYAKKIF